MFLAKHTDDQGKRDEFSIWWPEWYIYKNTKYSQEILYNQRILISPHACIDRNRYIQWAIELKLPSIPESNEEEMFYPVEPFNFKLIDQKNRARKKIILTNGEAYNNSTTI